MKKSIEIICGVLVIIAIYIGFAYVLLNLEQFATTF